MKSLFGSGQEGHAPLIGSISFLRSISRSILRRDSRPGPGVIAIFNLVLLFDIQALSASIITESGYHELYPGDGPPGGMQFQSFTVPFAASYSAVNPINGASVSGSYQVSASQISISYDLSRPPTQPLPPLEMALADGYVDFTVDEVVQYVLSAEMTVVDSEGRNTTQWLRLFQNGAIVFNNSQLSHSTPNEHFVLGEQGGDFDNILVGTMTGTLLPGRSYRLQYYSRLLDEPSPSLQTATATGFYRLAIVPEPSAAILIALGMLGLASFRSYDPY